MKALVVAVAVVTASCATGATASAAARNDVPDFRADPDCLPALQRQSAGFACAETGSGGAFDLSYRKHPADPVNLSQLAEQRSREHCQGEFQWPAVRDRKARLATPDGGSREETVGLEVFVRCVYLDEPRMQE